jgi:2'-5' RNA ligase
MAGIDCLDGRRFVSSVESGVSPDKRRFFTSYRVAVNVYSVNVPVPGEVAALASDIARDLPEARARVRGEHTLGVKRLADGDEPAYGPLEARAREVLVGQPAFEVSVTNLDYFDEAVTGTSPVVYLAVESPGLTALHRRLAETFEPLEGIEGEGYTPHVTVARGGSLDRAKAVVERDIEPITWTVSKLMFWDARLGEQVSTVSLPA